MNIAVSNIVLAAGLSRRMGKINKLLLPMQEITLLETTLMHILEARVGETFVIVGHEAAEVVTTLSYDVSDLNDDVLKFKQEWEEKTTVETSTVKFQTQKGPLSINAIFGQKIRKNGQFFTILENPNYETGMTTSIQTGVAAANEASAGFMICLSDMPFIMPSDYQFLAEKFGAIVAKDSKAIVQPIFEGKRGNPTILSHFYKQDILNLTYMEGCKPIVQANTDHVYLVEMPTDAVLRDIDTAAAYVQATSVA